MNKKMIVIIILLGSVVAGFYMDIISKIFYKPVLSIIQEVTKHNGFEIVAENLNIPWEIVFLPDGDLLVNERLGTVKRISSKKFIILKE